MAIVGKLFLMAVESDRARAIAPGVSRSGQRFSRIVLDTEYPRKRPLEPDLGELSRCAPGIRRIGKRNVISVRLELSCEPDRVSAVNLENIARLKRVDVFFQDAN